MEINGLPLHPLLVHAAVVFTPLAALTALVYALVTRWREKLRWPMVVLAVVATLAVVAAFLSGKSFLDSIPALAERPIVRTHEERAELLLWLTLGFGAVALVSGWLHARSGPVGLGLRALLAVAAAAVLVQVALTGDAGSRAVWGAIGG